MLLVIWCVCSNATGTPKLSERFSFRNMRLEDIPEVSQLCAECFEGPFNALQFFQKSQATNEFKTQIRDRYAKLVVEGKKHTMLVVADVEDGEIVGFVECGLLPRPPVPVSETKTSAASNNLKGSLSTGEKEAIQSEVAKAIQEASQEMKAMENNENGQEIGGESEGEGEGEEVPYLGNVAVKEKVRRQGIGRKLVQVSMKLAVKAGEKVLFVIVDASNDRALSMYKSLGFTCCLDERDLISRRRSSPRVFLEKRLEKGDEKNSL